MKYKGKNFIISEDFGVLKKNTPCYCFHETSDYIVLWFRTAVIGGMNEIKIAKSCAHILKET